MNGGIYLPPLTKLNKTIIIAIAAMFLLTSILSRGFGISLDAVLALSTLGVSKGLIFQLITYPIIGGGLIAVVFNALLFWFIGCDLERQWGVKRYLTFLAVAIIGGGLVFLGITALIYGTLPTILAGMTGATSALLMAYAILYPDRIFTFMLIFPMKAKYFCMILVAMQLYMAFFSLNALSSWGVLGSMLSGFLYMMAVSRQSFKIKLPKKKKKNHLRVVPDDDTPPKYWQ